MDASSRGDVFIFELPHFGLSAMDAGGDPS
jgi:hypothetical protein